MQTFIIGNIKFDNLLCVSLKKEVFLKLPLIKKYVYNEDYYNMLLESLKCIHEQSPERILDSISTANDVMAKQFGQKITQETSVLYYSSILWEWFYLLAYYIHQLDNDPLWKENYLPHTKAFQIRSLAIEETKKGEKLINQFIAKRQRVLETQKKIQQQAAIPGDDSIATLEAKIAVLESENTSLKARIAELEKKEATVTSKALSGRPKTELFEDADDCQKEKELLLKYLKKHNLSSTLITCEKDSTILQTLAVFYWHWEKKYHFPKINTAAYYRFLHDRCGLQFKIVEKSFGNVMGLILRHKQSFPDISGSVKEFIQRNSTQDIL